MSFLILLTSWHNIVSVLATKHYKHTKLWQGMKRHDTLQRHLKSNTIIYTKSAFMSTFSTFQYSITETTAGRGFLSQRKKWDMVRDHLKTRKEVQQQRQHTCYLWAAKRSQHYFLALGFPWNQLPAVLLFLSTVVRRHIHFPSLFFNLNNMGYKSPYKNTECVFHYI